MTTGFQVVLCIGLILGARAAVAQETEVETQEAAEQAEPLTAPPRVRQVEVMTGRGGRGIALDPEGNARLHFRLDAGAGFDTNPYTVPFGVTTNQFTGDLTTRIRPAVDFSYPGSKVTANAGLTLDYGFLPNIFGDTSGANWLLYNLSGQGTLELNRGGMFTAAVTDSVSSANDPGLINLGAIFTRINNRFGLATGVKAGTFGARLLYDFGFEKWFDPNFGLFGDVAGQPIREGAFDQMSHGLTLRLDYRFLPKTGLFLEARGAWNTYPFDVNNLNPDSFPVAASLGLMGQLSTKLSGLVSVGYSNPLVLDQLPDGSMGITTQGIIGLVTQAEAQWKINGISRLTAGVLRNFQPAPLYQYVTSNRVHIRYEQAVGAKLVLTAGANFTFLQFGEEQQVIIDGVAQDVTDTEGTDRYDGVLGSRVNLSYFLLDWVSVAVANDFEWRLTNANAVTGGNLSYLSNETLLLASVHY
ncbi:MAG: outer membrane beta-barrel protein [Myxococcota bacterium]